MSKDTKEEKLVRKPCACGYTKIALMVDRQGLFSLRCDVCGYMGWNSWTAIGAALTWNEAIDSRRGRVVMAVAA